MATNYTQHYHLPQWAADDHVLRDEFNQAWADVDAGLEAARYAVGNYTGNGQELSAGGLSVHLGFRPRFVLISRGLASANGWSRSTFFAVEQPQTGAERYCTFTDTGMVVGLCQSVTAAVNINEANAVYCYVAFR